MPPDARVLRRALAALPGLGFSFAAGGEPFVDLDDEEALAVVVGSQATLTARSPEFLRAFRARFTKSRPRR